MNDFNGKLTGLKTILHKAQTYCAYQDRCSSEVIQKLKAWRVDENRIPAIIEALVREKFIDDGRYAETFISSKFRLKHWGRIKIAYELRLKKIPPPLINQGLESIDENEYAETIQNLITQKTKEINDNYALRKKQKIARYLITKGFESELVFTAMNLRN
jgi:regulatory protein